MSQLPISTSTPRFSISCKKCDRPVDLLSPKNEPRTFRCPGCDATESLEKMLGVSLYQLKQAWDQYWGEGTILVDDIIDPLHERSEFFRVKIHIRR